MQNVSHIPLEKLEHLIEYGVYIPTFEEYVRHTVENQRSMINDLHFGPQHMFLSVTKVRYDYIIQMEFAQEISTNFLNKLEIDLFSQDLMTNKVIQDYRNL